MLRLKVRKDSTYTYNAIHFRAVNRRKLQSHKACRQGVENKPPLFASIQTALVSYIPQGLTARKSRSELSNNRELQKGKKELQQREHRRLLLLSSLRKIAGVLITMDISSPSSFSSIFFVSFLKALSSNQSFVLPSPPSVKASPSNPLRINPFPPSTSVTSSLL